jgi:tetrahydromethanopterin S-methyltransferase subunit E
LKNVVIEGERYMVYCTYCGTRNDEGAQVCVKCGATIAADRPVRRRRNRPKRDDECFGLPHGGAIVGLIFGAIIILYGLSSVFGWSIDFGSWAIILFGLLIVAGAVYGLTRRNR